MKKTRRGNNLFYTLITLSILTSASFAAFGQAVTPSALVADLYKQHNAKKSPFFQSKNRPLVDKYFTKATAALIWKDSTTTSGEVGALDGDPLYDAQDTDIKKFMIGKASINGEKASVPVTFMNFDQKKTVTFALVKEGGKWKIDDIGYGADYTLVSMLKEDAGRENAEFRGDYHVGPTTCTVTPVKMAYEVRWLKGKGVEMFFFKEERDGKFVFESEKDKSGRTSRFVFDDGTYRSGTYYRGDGKIFTVSKPN
jgi:hypothetical protein